MITQEQFIEITQSLDDCPAKKLESHLSESLRIVGALLAAESPVDIKSLTGIASHLASASELLANTGIYLSLLNSKCGITTARLTAIQKRETDRRGPS